MAEQPVPLLELRDVNVSYGEIHALRGVTFDVQIGRAHV